MTEHIWGYPGQKPGPRSSKRRRWCPVCGAGEWKLLRWWIRVRRERKDVDHQAVRESLHGALADYEAGRTMPIADWVAAGKKFPEEVQS